MHFTHVAIAVAGGHGEIALGRLQLLAQQLADGYTLTTSYLRDQFGNVAQTSQAWLDPLHNAQTTRILASTTYESHGRFPQVRKNATCFTSGGVCQSETWFYDAGTGVKTSVFDINNLTTSWTVNGFGRVLAEIRPDNTETDYYQKQCNGACPNTIGGTPVALTIADHVTVPALGSVRVATPELHYSDSAGHQLRSLTWGFDGSEIDTDTTYDFRGRVNQTYQPTYSGVTPVLAWAKLYDELNRAIKEQVADETGTLQTTESLYRGLTVVTTNPKSQQKTEIHDALGQLIQTVDAIGGNTYFTYDSFGDLVQTNDPMLNQVNMAYDLLGRKTTLSDPDLGIVTYGIDPRGLQWQQVSPNERLLGQTTSFQYDVLDRLVQRSEPDLSSYWVFDQVR